MEGALIRGPNLSFSTNPIYMARSDYWRGKNASRDLGSLVNVYQTFGKSGRMVNSEMAWSRDATEDILNGGDAQRTILSEAVLKDPDMAMGVTLSQTAAERGQAVINKTRRTMGNLSPEMSLLLRNGIAAHDSQILLEERGEGFLPYFDHLRDTAAVEDLKLDDVKPIEQAIVGATSLLMGLGNPAKDPAARDAAQRIADAVKHKPGQPTYRGTPKLLGSENISDTVTKILEPLYDPNEDGGGKGQSCSMPQGSSLAGMSDTGQGDSQEAKNARDLAAREADVKGGSQQMKEEGQPLGIRFQAPSGYNHIETITAEPEPRGESTYNATANQYINVIEDVREALRFRLSTPTLHEPAHRTGDFDAHSMTKLLTGDVKVFERIEHQDTPRVSVGILVDESGSMGGDKIVQARNAAIILYEALKGMQGVNLWIYGHTFEGIGQNMVRRYVTNNIEAYEGAIGSMRARSSNADGFALQALGIDIAAATPESDQGLILVISDGQPAATNYGGEGARVHIDGVATALRARNIEVLGIGLGSMRREDIAIYYRNEFSFGAPDVNALGSLISNIVTQHLS